MIWKCHELINRNYCTRVLEGVEKCSELREDSKSRIVLINSLIRFEQYKIILLESNEKPRNEKQKYYERNETVARDVAKRN